MNAKRYEQDVVIYTPELEPFRESSIDAEEEQHTRKLAKALALAVDTKDSYTRSHCQTVATLCAVIAAELGFEDGRLKRVRLAGEEIPLESRIIHVADCFEAMTSDRPYRPAPGERFAIEELQRHAGTQFDQEVVDALLRVVGATPLGDTLIEEAFAVG